MTSDAPIVEDELQAYVDGRLSEARRAAVDAHLAQHPDVRERVPSRCASAQPARPTRRKVRRAGAAAPVDRQHPGRPPRDDDAAPQGSGGGRAHFAVGAGAGWFAADHETMATVPCRRPPPLWRRTRPPPTHLRGRGRASGRGRLGAGRPSAAMAVSPSRQAAGGARPDAVRLQVDGRPAAAGQWRAAAQFMYDDASGKRLTLYIRAAEGSETAFRFQREGDAATFAWIDQGLSVSR